MFWGRVLLVFIGSLLVYTVYGAAQALFVAEYLKFIGLLFAGVGLASALGMNYQEFILGIDRGQLCLLRGIGQLSFGIAILLYSTQQVVTNHFSGAAIFALFGLWLLFCSYRSLVLKKSFSR